MILTRRTLAAASASAVLLPRAGRAQAKGLKIGVLNDESGPYRDDGGPTSALCVRQAVAEFGDKGFPIEVIVADHQNKPDVGAGIARRWFDQDGVDVIVDVPTSSVALAVNNVCRDKNKLMLNNGAATTDLTGVQCSPNTVHWTYDTYMLARSTGGATNSSATPPASSWRLAARCSAAPATRSRTHRTSPTCWCRRRRAAPRCWAYATAARTRSIASSKHASSA